MNAFFALPLLLLAAAPDTCPEVLPGNGLSPIEEFIEPKLLKQAPAWGSALRGFLVTHTESAPFNDATEFNAVLASEEKAYHVRQSIPLPARAVATLEVTASASKGQLWCVNAAVTLDSNGVRELRLESSRPQVFTVTLKGAGQTRVWRTSVLQFTSTGELVLPSETERPQRPLGLTLSNPVALWRTWRLLGLNVPVESPLPPTPVCPPETKWVVEPDDEVLGSHDEGCVSKHCGFSASGRYCPQHGPRRSVFFNGRLRASGEMKEGVPVESTWHFWKPNGEPDPNGG